MHKLEPPDTHCFLGAVGWLELGNLAEARAELAQVSAAQQEHPDVLEVFRDLCSALDLKTDQPSALRRNLLVSGADLNPLIGEEFEFQGVQFAAVEECRPCRWMNHALGPGAEDWLRGRGGLRCRILTSGWLRVPEEPAG